MPSRNRDTLKYFFSDGAMPSSDMFADLIDSMLNMDDEGFTKSDENGFEITNFDDSDSLISFYNQSHPEEPLWKISFDGSQKDLVLGRANTNSLEPIDSKENEKFKYALKLDAATESLKVGIGLAKPLDTLHVAGNVRTSGRRGDVDSAYSSPLADGNWHTIAGPFVGCQTLEIVARAKNDVKKRYGMMHAIAMHTISPGKKGFFSFLGLKNRIKYTHSFYDSLLHRLKLRWRPGKERGQYILQIRSNCDYGEDGIIDFHITNLWSDQDYFPKSSGSESSKTSEIAKG